MGCAAGVLLITLLVVIVLFVRKYRENRKDASSAWDEGGETVTFNSPSATPNLIPGGTGDRF